MDKFLLNWKSKDNRYPLIIRGLDKLAKHIQLVILVRVIISIL